MVEKISYLDVFLYGWPLIFAGVLLEMREGILADEKEYATRPLRQLLKGEIFGISQQFLPMNVVS